MTFKKGAYDIYCPIPGHKALGMNVNIRVGAAAATTGSTAKTSGSGSSGGTAPAAAGRPSDPGRRIASPAEIAHAVHAWAHVR